VVSLIFKPSLDRELVQQRTVVTMDAAMADYAAPPLGIPIDDIPLENYRIQVWFRHQAHEALGRMAIRGYAFWDQDDIHVYGPWPSRMLHDALVAPGDLDTAPENVVEMVHSPSVDGAFVDYWLVANFVKKPVPMDEEALGHAPLPEELLA
jgi:hypothetical protein